MTMSRTSYASAAAVALSLVLALAASAQLKSTTQAPSPRLQPATAPQLATMPQAQLQPPNVTRHEPATVGSTSGTLRIEGRDFVPSAFTVRIGAQALTIVERTSSRIVARLPAERSVGPLVVGYGSPASEVTLAASYRVAGAPVIASVSPVRFGPGMIVTLSGRDLDQAQPFGLGNETLVRIGPVGYSYLPARQWQSAADGASARFQVPFPAPSIYQWSPYSLQLIAGNVTALAGKLTVQRVGGNTAESASATDVRYEAGYVTPLEVSTLHASRTWSGQRVDFVIVQPSPTGTENRVLLTGSGLWNTSARIGTQAITMLSCSVSGLDCWASLPYAASTGRIAFTRSPDGATASSPVVRVVPAPRVTSAQPVRTRVNQDFVLRGYDLVPGTAVSGLSYTARLEGASTSVGTLRVVRQSATEWTLRVEHPSPSQIASAAYGVVRYFDLVASYANDTDVLVRVPLVVER